MSLSEKTKMDLGCTAKEKECSLRNILPLRWKQQILRNFGTYPPGLTVLRVASHKIAQLIVISVRTVVSQETSKAAHL
jgi:hypothetical protein